MHLGEFLKTEREKKGIRLADIASVTKIPVHQLKLIEDGKWGSLPPKPFIKGFLTSYTRYIGLNPNEVYQRYLAETEPQVDTTLEPQSVTQEPKPRPSDVLSSSKVLQIKPIAFSVLGVLALVISLWLIRIGRESDAPDSVASAPTVSEETTREVASTPESQPDKVVPEPAPPSPTPSDSAPTNATESESHTLEVLTKERSWAKVVIDEAPPVEYHINPGEKTTLTATSKIKLVLGNASGAEVVHNGTPDPGKVDQGTVRYYIFPVGAKFPQDQTRRKLSEDSEKASDDSVVNQAEGSSSE